MCVSVCVCVWCVCCVCVWCVVCVVSVLCLCVVSVCVCVSVCCVVCVCGVCVCVCVSVCVWKKYCTDSSIVGFDILVSLNCNNLHVNNPGAPCVAFLFQWNECTIF